MGPLQKDEIWRAVAKQPDAPHLAIGCACGEVVMLLRFKSFHAVAMLAGLSAALAACDGGTIYKKGSLGSFQTLSVDARQRLVIVGTRQVRWRPRRMR